MSFIFPTRPSSKTNKTNIVKTSIVLALAASLSSFCAYEAFAFDTQSWLKQMEEKAAQNNVTLSYDSVEQNGDDAVIKGLKLGKKKEQSLIIDTLTLENISDMNDGRMGVEMLEAKGLAFNNGKITSPALRGSNLILDLSQSDSFTMPIRKAERLELEPVDMAMDNSNGGEFEGNFKGIIAEDYEYIDVFNYSILKLEVGAFHVNGKDKEGRAIEFTFDGMKAHNLIYTVFAGNWREKFARAPMSSLEMGGAQFLVDGAKIGGMKGGNVTSNFDEKSDAFDSKFEISGMYIDLSAMPDFEANPAYKIIRDMGYKRFNLNYNGEIYWQISKGSFDLKNIEMLSNEVGGFNLNLKLEGLTDKLYAEYSQHPAMHPSAAFGKSPAELQKLQMEQLAVAMQYAQKLSLNRLSLTINDDSLTRRLLKMQADKSGQKVEDIAAGIPFMAMLTLQNLKSPVFAEAASKAVTAFIKSASTKDSGKITLSLTPTTPIPFNNFMAYSQQFKTGKMTADQLVEQLGVTITGE